MPGALSRLVEELSVGVAQLAPDGAVLAANAAASELLDGNGGAGLHAALARLAARAAEVGHRVTEALLPGPLGELRVLLAPAEGQGAGEGEARGWLVLLHRDPSRRLRDQAIALRGMLAAAVEDDRPEAALQRSLDALSTACRGSQLVLWTVDARGEPEPALRARSAEAPGDAAAALPLVRRALESGLPVHQPLPVRPAPAAPLHGLRPHGDPGAALAIPVRGGEETVAVLHAVGPRLGEGELRLLTGLADAAGALLGRVRAEAGRDEAERQADRARAVAVEREGLATLGHLTACVTHEIAGPLGCLGTNLRAARESADLLAAEAGAGPGAARARAAAAELGQVLDDAAGDIERVLALVQSLRGLYRRKDDDALRFDPSGPVRDAVRIFQGAHRLRGDVALAIGAPLPDVEGSPGLLCQVVLNLLDNGFDACAGRATLQVRLGAGPDGGVVLEVEDAGTGIPPEVAPRIFDAYFTTKPPGQGTGLGLYICRDVVERMGGHVAFRTAPGGTTFTVRLPPPGPAAGGPPPP